MKMAPVVHEMKKQGLEQILVHTGQHYDHQMSKLFFDELDMPRPGVNLDVGSGPHGEQTGEIMKRIEPVLIDENPDLVIVAGDVNSTIACALTATKLGIPVAHVEAGLRSFDRSMPEEINRILTDAISDYLFVSEESAMVNLRNEGIAEDKIYFVGNTMIDTLLKHRQRAQQIRPLNGLKSGTCPYGVLTLHRPGNVDTEEQLRNILEAMADIAQQTPVIFPAHPRTVKQIERFGLRAMFKNITEGVTSGMYMIEPLGYLQFLSLMSGARIVFTDSGGIQEETTVLGIPCITLRENTERPVTITSGTNVLAGRRKENIIESAKKALNGNRSIPVSPQYWDGRAAERIVAILRDKLAPVSTQSV